RLHPLSLHDALPISQPAAGNSLPEGQQSTMITDDLPSKSSRFILPLGNGRSALVKTDPKGAFSLEGELRHMDGFTPFRIHSGSRDRKSTRLNSSHVK